MRHPPLQPCATWQDALVNGGSIGYCPDSNMPCRCSIHDLFRVELDMSAPEPNATICSSNFERINRRTATASRNL